MPIKGGLRSWIGITRSFGLCGCHSEISNLKVPQNSIHYTAPNCQWKLELMKTQWQDNLSMSTLLELPMKRKKLCSSRKALERL